MDENHVVNYYPDKDPKMNEEVENHPDTEYDLFKSEDLFPLSIRQRKRYIGSNSDTMCAL